MDLAINFLLGIGVGCYGTLVGAGGGFVLVSSFLLLYKMPHEIAVGTSLAVIVFNAVSGSVGYMRARLVDYRVGVVFALATLPGAILGASLTTAVSGPAFNRIFGALLVVLSLYLFRRRARKQKPLVHGQRGWGWVTRRTKSGEEFEYYEPLGVGISLVVGTISTWIGIGGGILHVPAMTEILRFPVHTAVATSHFVLAFTALAGALVHASRGHWDMRVALSVGLGAVVGAQLGVILSRRLQGSMILRYLSLALLLVGIRLVFFT